MAAMVPPKTTNLVGGIPTPLKNMSSSVGMDYPIYYGKIKNIPKCSKPPSS
jgi:hypothetical protein